MIALVYDTETTGLVSTGLLDLKRQPHVIEYYGAVTEFKKSGKFDVLSELEFLCKPPYPISAEITKITGITNDMLADQKTFDHYHAKVRKQLELAPLVIAHNAAFDRQMIDFEFARLQQTLKWPRTLCTIEQTMHLQGKRIKLTDMHMLLFNEKFSAHRGKSDVLALCRCIGELHRQGII